RRRTIHVQYMCRSHDGVAQEKVVRVRRFVDAPRKPTSGPIPRRPRRKSPQPTPREAHIMKGRSNLILTVLCLIGFFPEGIVARADELVKFRMITHAIS